MHPSDWNIVILGAWNRAILTPAWIQEIVFALPHGSTVDVLVPMDTMFAPFQVHDKGLTVIPAPGQLILQLTEPTEALLTRAMEASRRAMQDLPRTPLQACGLNLRYAAPELPLALLERSRCKTEQLFSNHGYELQMRRRGETLSFKEGTMSVIADIPTTGPCTVTLNFERQSQDRTDLLNWLSRGAAEYIQEAQTVIALIAD